MRQPIQTVVTLVGKSLVLVALLALGISCSAKPAVETAPSVEDVAPKATKRPAAQQPVQPTAAPAAVRTVARTVAPTPRPTVAPTAAPTAPVQAAACDANYSGACLDPQAADYDCEGGDGNGPKYTGRVTVVGDDHYDLDSDGDGVACDG